MADAVKCCICEYYKFHNNTCLVYPKGIPKNIFMENNQCPKYSIRKVDNDKDIPFVTKGK